MFGTSPTRYILEFGPFRLHPDEHRLYRNGENVPLAPKVYDLLLVLVLHPGQVLDRERLLRAVWPDTLVEEANLNVTISMLRKALGETPNECHYIETLPRLGYRFIAEVRELQGDTQLSADQTVQPSEPVKTDLLEKDLFERANVTVSNQRSDSIGLIDRRRLTHRLIWVALPIGMVMAVLASLVIWRAKTFSAEEVKAELMVLPLTTYQNRELSPALSPDGGQIAFAWSGTKDDNVDIYVRLVEGSDPIRITNSAAEEINPVWSPDNSTIAFYRHGAESDGIYLAPSLGGAERKLTATFSNRFSFGAHSWLDWSPNDKWLVVSDKGSEQEPFSLYLLSSETGERRRVTTPPNSMIGDCSPAFSPDGRTLAFVRVVSAVVGDIYLVPLNGGEPTRITYDNQGINNLAWTPDGREIVFSSRRGGIDRLWQVPASGGNLRWLSATGINAQAPAFSRHGSRLAWMQITDNADIFRIDLKNNAETRSPVATPAPLIASTLQDYSPSYSPNGHRIAFVSHRSGSPEIWACESTGERPIQLTFFRGPLAGSPRWSPAADQIAFDCRPEGNADIYLINSEGGNPVRLTNDPAEDVVPNWSHDGKWIYFASNRSGKLQIWKMAASGGEAVQLTTQGGFESFESPDGRWLYYTRERGVSSIWRVPVGGGDETLVLDFRQADYYRMWTATKEGIYFAVSESAPRSVLKFFSFSSGKVSTITTIDYPMLRGTSGLTVSSDGRWLLFPLIAQYGSDIMLMENFR